MLNAQTGVDVTDMLLDSGTDAVNMADDVSSATFTGDFSFVKRAWLDENAGCDAADTTASDLRMDEEDGARDTTKLMAQSIAYLNANSNLCIEVYGEGEMAMPIPATAPYMVAKTIVLGSIGEDDFGEDSLFKPLPAPAPLGAIMRDGTTVRLPYLTQFPQYNQRIIIRNRGGAAPYSFTFHTEDGITATPGADAEGMLPANSVTVLSMMFDDVVTIEGTHNRTAATFVVESAMVHIDVSVSQTNMDGGTDTTHLTDTNR